MDLFDQVDWIKQVGLAGARRAATHIHPSHRAQAAENYCAAGQSLFILRLTHLDAPYIYDGILKCHQASYRMELFIKKKFALNGCNKVFIAEQKTELDQVADQLQKLAPLFLEEMYGDVV
jgi:hypothetical protein